MMKNRPKVQKTIRYRLKRLTESNVASGKIKLAEKTSNRCNEPLATECTFLPNVKSPPAQPRVPAGPKATHQLTLHALHAATNQLRVCTKAKHTAQNKLISLIFQALAKTVKFLLNL